ncbi:MAG: DEAD/DEAH box helicase [Hymenobacter sp.]|nr:MAG: DEAD/DEAH box helicase [Hymenobacter sp.]
MKAVISNRIYLEVDSATNQRLRETLTYRIPTYGDGPPMIVQNYFVFKPGILSIPVGRTDLIPPGYTIVDKRVGPEVEFPPFKGELRDSQHAIYDAVDDNCLINAKVGWGKTYMALALAAKLGFKVLVVVHTLALMHQWAKEVEHVFGFKPGLIGDGHDNTQPPIVIGNVASLYKRMDRLGKLFGTVIMDEVHHAPSPTFSKIVDRSYARYKIGLSGTLERKDGLHVLLPDYFGYKVYKPERENTLTPTIHAYHTGIYFPFGDIWAHRVSALNQDPRYIAWTLDRMQHYCRMGHRALLVSDRVEFLERIAAAAGSALIIGKTEDRDSQFKRLDNGETNSLCGTLSIFKEGISYNPLSMVQLGTPINNEPMLEQVIGRVQRQFPGKLNPVVVDPILIDLGSI